MTYPPGMPPPRAPVRPAAWLPDPLDDALLRYWNGHRWTFHTTLRPRTVPVETEVRDRSTTPPEKPRPALRQDIAAALHQVRGGLAGSMKEVHLLADYLEPEEHVLALTGAQGEGFGILACTDRRLVFLFVGLIRKQFLHVNWNQAKAIHYNQATRTFAVYTTKPTKRATPAVTIRVHNLDDAKTIAHTAQTASAAPRLDIT